MTDTYGLIREAILNKRHISAVYQGHRREMCPHVIGRKHGRQQALCYQYGGTSSSGLAPAGSWGNWRCVIIDQLQSVEVHDGDGKWYTAGNHSRPQTCVDEIDVEVEF